MYRWFLGIEIDDDHKTNTKIIVNDNMFSEGLKSFELIVWGKQLSQK